MLHRFPTTTTVRPSCSCSQLATLRSEAAATTLAENYVGLAGRL